MSERHSGQIPVVTRADRERLHQHRGFCVWLTGLSGAGKTTLARLLAGDLHGRGVHTYVLDGDDVRSGLNRDLGFDEEDRLENVRRIAHVARMFVEAGTVVIVAVISPYRASRQEARSLIGADSFVEVFVDCPLSVCQQRDPKGLYARVAAGQLSGMTGMAAPYEAPLRPDLHVTTADIPLAECAERLYQFVLPQLRVP
ncbi:adenylyl-sulfate kinase [Alicyclobacillus shizuokensis]|uniref:adenylyl-sulfate kinase n=1 Tax=Alicyclobacillus shizuokensis TaxID=392014 RepID=UPI000B0DF2CA|nr:adenylyl-sulfate kinase [Alicyclobacillus shizuokensis]MCL6626133.1 adenylyl-sulfate kinase [Alicyclobacillus shizuokensis]